MSWHYPEGTGLGNETLLVQRVQSKPLTVQPFPLRYPPPGLLWCSNRWDNVMTGTGA